MTREKLAAMLDGREYSSEINKAEAKQANKDGLVVIYGYSDDNIELAGAIDEEIGAYDGTTLFLHRGGILEDDEECEECHKRFLAESKKCVRIDCIWDGAEEVACSWYIKPNGIEFSPFNIMEDGELFCRGVVIDVNDLPEI